jgi:rhamnose utilization protein RhaD (predicted bifunctional aldolase and dehydrogenase)/NAD(P)-dependent dehydrogenase (short-subunit alcohol dehydrogenase family)
MNNRWNESEANSLLDAVENPAQQALSHRIYSARLIGMEPDLVLHGGGNVSVKTTVPNTLGEATAAAYVKVSGCDLRTIGQVGFVALDQDYLSRLLTLESLDDAEMKDELSLHMLRPHHGVPSIEALMHVSVPAKYIDHTHPAPILALTNRTDGERFVMDALGERVCVVQYAKPGFELAKAVAQAFEIASHSEGMVLMHHGLITWGETAKEAYSKTVDLVSRAEQYLESSRGAKRTSSRSLESPSGTREPYRAIAPVLRGMLIPPKAEMSMPVERVILRPLLTDQIQRFLESGQGRELATAPPLTPDNIIRTGIRPLWIDSVDIGDNGALGTQLAEAIAAFSRDQGNCSQHHTRQDGRHVVPKVVMIPGTGIACAGRDARDADIARDITDQTISVKTTIAETGGTYEGLSEDQLYAMEYDVFQQAKLRRQETALPAGTVALVTGAAGAIGSGVCESLLAEGAHVAVTDLGGEELDGLVECLLERDNHRVLGLSLDVTDEKSVAEAFAAVVDTWGGLDLLVVNAGVAHVSLLADMDLQDFQRLERVNVEGALLVIREAARLFEKQGAGGDIVLVSTKNVFAPGAGFGAYSATKAACHQLARIASLELAKLDVRVNMVSPDAVFSHSGRKSGLWSEVGPGRMKARGLDQQGLEEYYRNRNLLKARVSAEDVARAVMFFATRQTPTTGATLPVDGGLPDSTPR